MDQIPCPDGYLLDAKSPLAVGHHALNDFLVRVEDAGWETATKEVNAIRDKGRKLLIWKALLERVEWVRGEQTPLRGLAERIENWTLSLTEDDLIDLLARTSAVRTFLAPYPVMPHLIDHIDKHGLTPELAGAIRSFRTFVYDNCLQVSQTSIQMFRSRMDMLAWRDEWTPIERKRCWSEMVRADFRAMEGAEKENWRSFLYLIHGDEGTHPAPKWLAAADAAIAKIGPDAFRNRLARWLAPLRSDTVHRLSREGSYILRCFLWYADRAQAAEITRVEFKPKANGQKVIRGAAETAGLPDPTTPLRSATPLYDEVVSRALSVALSPMNAPVLAGRVEIAGDVVLVRGNRDSYEIHVPGGAIFRKSDGCRVRIPSAGAPAIAAPMPGMGAVLGILRDAIALVQDDRHARCVAEQA